MKLKGEMASTNPNMERIKKEDKEREGERGEGERNRKRKRVCNLPVGDILDDSTLQN